MLHLLSLSDKHTQDSCGRGIGLLQRRDKTQHPCGIRTRNPSKRAAAERPATGIDEGSWCGLQ